jgi:hypothetical protein
MVSPDASPVPVISTVPPLFAVPACAKPVGGAWTTCVMTTLPLPAFSPEIATNDAPLSIDPPPPPPPPDPPLPPL